MVMMSHVCLLSRMEQMSQMSLMSPRDRRGCLVHRQVETRGTVITPLGPRKDPSNLPYRLCTVCWKLKFTFVKIKLSWVKIHCIAELLLLQVNIFKSLKRRYPYILGLELC